MKQLFSKDTEELDRPTQKILYEQFYNMVYRIAIKYVGEEFAASDVVQETFICAYKYISTYEDKNNGSFEGWLSMIARNQAKKYVKQRWKYNEIPSEEVFIDVESHVKNEGIFVEDRVIDKLTVEEIKSMLAMLPPRDRHVILLRLSYERSYPEIAAIMGMSESSARQRYHRAIIKLRKLLHAKWDSEKF
ncbi:putative RNA polymerase, sigma-24 subunit, ECF subfamily [[Clostridium] ultunense Esp]|nr:putative RNA polymerase, sigma-24 subunit, ECF subfamily [[Clostridium] ultunense Esp]